MQKNPEPLNLYLRAMKLQTEQDYQSALPLLSQSFQDIQSIKEGFEFNRLFVQVGGTLASLYELLGMIQEALQTYNRIFDFDPENSFLGDFAIFLHRKIKDYERADFFYRKSLEIYPTQSTIHLKYAGFLRHVRKDLKAADHHYQLACETNPQHSDALGSYASFLHGVSKDITQAEIYYEKAIEADSFHSNNLCNFGLFLSEEKLDFTRAEFLYRKSLEVNSEHANTLYNFAVMLDTHCDRKSEAEGLYRKCIEVDPRHAYALYNLAVLLEDRSNKQIPPDETTNHEICSLLKRAVDCDTRDPVTLADYGRFVWTKLDEVSIAQAVLTRALEFDPRSEVALYNLGLLFQKHHGQFTEAEELFRRLLQVNPNHFACTLQLSRLIANRSLSTGLDEFAVLYERAIELADEPQLLVLEYLHICLKLGKKSIKERAFKYTESFISQFQTRISPEALSTLIENIALLK